MQGEVINPKNIQPVAQSIFHFDRDDRKSVYLSYRVTGFTVAEALQLTGMVGQTLRNWRKTDPEFCDVEKNRLKEVRDQLAKDVVRLEYLRNLRLVLKKDFDILRVAVKDIEKLAQRDFQYLLKARQHYTPQQLQAIEALLAGVGAEDFDYSKFIITLKRTHEEMQIAATRNIP